MADRTCLLIPAALERVSWGGKRRSRDASWAGLMGVLVRNQNCRDRRGGKGTASACCEVRVHRTCLCFIVRMNRKKKKMTTPHFQQLGDWK